MNHQAVLDTPTAAVLKAARDKCGKTNRQIADELSFSKESVDMWFFDPLSMSFRELVALGNIIGISVLLKEKPCPNTK